MTWVDLVLSVMEILFFVMAVVAIVSLVVIFIKNKKFTFKKVKKLITEVIDLICSALG